MAMCYYIFNCYYEYMYKVDQKYSCIILAGGKGKRVSGQDKGLLEYKHKPLIRQVIDSVQQQVDDIVISANRNIHEYQSLGCSVIPDSDSSYRGPMSGIASCLKHCHHDWALVVACDMPQLPDNLVERLATGTDCSVISIAESEGRMQLAFLINKKISDSLQQALDLGQLRLMQWVRQQAPHTIAFSNAEAFRNLNHLADLECSTANN